MAILRFNAEEMQPIIEDTLKEKKFLLSLGQAVKNFEAAGTKWEWGDPIPSEHFHTDKPMLHLVKDHGIYIMTGAADRTPPHVICYAEGYSPSDKNWYEKAKDAVGGDDFCEAFNITLLMAENIKNGAELVIEISKDHFQVSTSLTVQQLVNKKDGTDNRSTTPREL